MSVEKNTPPELSEEELKQIDELVESQSALGLVSKAKEFYTGKLDLKEDDYIKVNLPESKAKFESGNGEGIWACPVTEADAKILNEGKKGDTFEVYVLNDCITYPFACASIITAEVTSDDTRPILSYDWMDETIKKLLMVK